jgi:hypothetical protein
MQGIPQPKPIIMEIALGLFGEREVRRQTSDKEIRRFLGVFMFSMTVFLFFLTA